MSLTAVTGQLASRCGAGTTGDPLPGGPAWNTRGVQQLLGDAVQGNPVLVCDVLQGAAGLFRGVPAADENTDRPVNGAGFGMSGNPDGVSGFVGDGTCWSRTTCPFSAYANRVSAARSTNAPGRAA